MMYLYQGKMIRGAWVDANGTQYPAGWVEGATPEQLAEIGVAVADDIQKPVHEARTHRAAQQDDGSWTLVEIATVAQLAEQKCDALEVAYVAAIGADIEFTTAGGITKSFQADESSRKAMHDTLAGTEADGETPPGFFWKAADNTLVSPFTRSDLLNLSRTMFYRGAAAFARLTQLKARARSVTTLAELDEINF